MLVAFVVASLIPFELFLFAYAVLGPLHYATEISWLYDRRFFAPRRIDAAGRYSDPAINSHYMSRRSADGGYGLTLEGMVNFAKNYVSASESDDWRVSPICAADLTGVAPAVIHTWYGLRIIQVGIHLRSVIKKPMT